MDFLMVEWNELVRKHIAPTRIYNVDHGGHVSHTIYSRKCVHVFILGCMRHVLGYCTLPLTHRVDNRNVFLNGY